VGNNVNAKSLLGLTGQSWKLVVGLLVLTVGSLAPLFEHSGLNWTTGTIVACVGYAFTLLAVRCPDCGSRWFWQAALDAGVYKPIFKGSACPSCKRDYR
jgi:hypothetical protein